MKAFPKLSGKATISCTQVITTGGRCHNSITDENSDQGCNRPTDQASVMCSTTRHHVQNIIPYITLFIIDSTTISGDKLTNKGAKSMNLYNQSNKLTWRI